MRDTFQKCDLIRIKNVFFPIILGHNVKDDSCDNEEKARYNEHYGTDERGEACNYASVYEINAYAAAKNQTNDADDQAETAKKGERLVFANHAEDGAHYLDAVSNGIKFADGTFRTVAVLNWHLVKTEIVIQRVDGHFGFDLKAAGQNWIGLHESEGERSVASHDVGYVGAEQSIDGSAHEPIAEIMEWSLVLLEVCGA